MCVLMSIITLITANPTATTKTGLDIICNEERHLLEGKTIGLITNKTGVDKFGKQNIECLQNINNLRIGVIFTPEHGFELNKPAGESIHNQDKINNIPVISLYGTHKQPTPQQLKNLDILVYDIQDIGVRSYTYISTLGLIMEVASNENVPLMILDRPNPLTGKIKQGQKAKMTYKSFINFYPIKTRYGLTIGELAKKSIKKNWVKSNIELTVIKTKHWKKNQWFDQTNLKWIPPSPNIPNIQTALLYSGMNIFEATNVSEGRGTSSPFLMIGAPWINGAKLANELNRMHLKGIKITASTFIPKAIEGKVTNPKYNNQVCEGIKIDIINRKQINAPKIAEIILKSITKLYPHQLTISKDYLNQLWGNDTLTNWILNYQNNHAI